MSKKVITPVGTSIFENYMKHNGSGINASYETLKDKSIDVWDNKMYAAHIEKVRKPVRDWAEKTLRKNEINASAEITSLVKILEEANEGLEVYLIATETIVSRLAAEILKDVLPIIEQNGHKMVVTFNPVHLNYEQRDVIKGLQVRDDERFQEEGLTNFFERIQSITENFTKKTVLNITGGFKAEIPYSTIISQVYDMPQCYIFEEDKNKQGTNHLLHIPRLPIQFDWSVAEKYYPYLCRDVEWASLDKPVKNELIDLHLMGETRQGKCYLTVIGKMLKRYVEKSLPLHKNVLGFFVEYKLFEYYITTPYKNAKGEEFKFVQRGIRNQAFNYVELDLLLRKTADNGTFVVVESKSFLQFFIDDYFSEVRGQIHRQIKAFEQNKQIPKEYHLWIYLYPGHKKEKQAILSKLTELKKLFGGLNNCSFRVFYLYIDLDCYDLANRRVYDNPYQKFMIQAITPDMIEEPKI